MATRRESTAIPAGIPQVRGRMRPLSCSGSQGECGPYLDQGVRENAAPILIREKVLPLRLVFPMFALGGPRG